MLWKQAVQLSAGDFDVQESGVEWNVGFCFPFGLDGECKLSSNFTNQNNIIY
jgi:hypothetical protein